MPAVARNAACGYPQSHTPRPPQPPHAAEPPCPPPMPPLPWVRGLGELNSHGPLSEWPIPWAPHPPTPHTNLRMHSADRFLPPNPSPTHPARHPAPHLLEAVVNGQLRHHPVVDAVGLGVRGREKMCVRVCVGVYHSLSRCQHERRVYVCVRVCGRSVGQQKHGRAFVSFLNTCPGHARTHPRHAPDTPPSPFPPHLLGPLPQPVLQPPAVVLGHRLTPVAGGGPLGGGGAGGGVGGWGFRMVETLRGWGEARVEGGEDRGER